jgi:hypothetical protein
MILRDYKCDEHGFFESDVPVCPHGCTDSVFAVYLKAPGLKSDRTKKADDTLKGLASDFNMTDIKSTREGEHQTGYLARNASEEAKREPRPGDNAIWGGGFKGLNMQNILAGRAVQSIHGESVGLNPKDAGNLTGPKAASYMQDHEGLAIKPD